MEKLSLDKNTTATAYNNKFKWCLQNLEYQGDNYMALMTKDMHLERIFDEDYMNLKDTLQNDKNIILPECIVKIHTKKQLLDSIWVGIKKRVCWVSGLPNIPSRCVDTNLQKIPKIADLF